MGTPSESQACSCAMPPSVGEAKNDSTAVFMGRALGVKVQNHLITLSGPIMNRQATLFEVKRVWKGGSQTQQIVYDPGGETSCGIDFMPGKMYLVYAYEDPSQDGILSTNLCTRTKEISQASEDSTALGQGIEATEQVDLSKELPESNTLELKVMIVVWAVMRSMAGLLAYVW